LRRILQVFLATGETARKRTAQPAAAASQELTAQEVQVVTKLGITSRGQLHRVLPGGPDAPGRLASLASAPARRGT
jgi:hypothetical protein